MPQAARRAYGGPGGVGCSGDSEGGAKIAYLGEEEQQRRIRAVVKKETGADCPDLKVEEIAVGNKVTLFYWCEAEEADDPKRLRNVVLSEDDAEYIGVDRTPRGGAETNQ
jgi:hypothetical protein